MNRAADVEAGLGRVDVHRGDDPQAMRDAICLATAAPIGPRPTCGTRMRIDGGLGGDLRGVGKAARTLEEQGYDGLWTDRKSVV